MTTTPNASLKIGNTRWAVFVHSQVPRRRLVFSNMEHAPGGPPVTNRWLGFSGALDAVDYWLTQARLRVAMRGARPRAADIGGRNPHC